MPCNALCDAAASPDVLIRRERAEPIEDEEDGRKKRRRVEGLGERKKRERGIEEVGWHLQWEREAFSL